MFSFNFIYLTSVDKFRLNLRRFQIQYVRKKGILVAK